MCGITGMLSWTLPADACLAQRMNDRLVHRGPDAEGIVTRGPATLASRRLSIIDVSDAANQPMSDHTGHFWIVFNGEIYNFLELRKKLATHGSRFQTQSDTEVILEAYKRWDIDCLQRLNGMFAFALWDEDRQRLFLARDRAGEKPLYYQWLPDGGLIFASELQALRVHPAVSRRINPTALGHYLSLNYTLTAACIIEGVQKLPAALYLLVEEGRSALPARYWDLAAHFRDKQRYRSEVEAAEALAALLEDSVRLRLISDVPLGAFLSGGIDSSTIVDADMAAALPRIVAAVDEPFADTSIIPFYFLAQFAREKVTVSLSGDGSDEIFAGYETYPADKLLRATQWAPRWLTSSTQRLADAVLPVSFDNVSFDYRVRKFLRGYPLGPQRAHYFWRVIFTDDAKRQLVRPEWRDAIAECDPFLDFQAYGREVADCHYLDQALYVDIKTWLVDDILVKVDRATMAHSLEARAPYLDHRLMEFAASLPVEWKLRRLRKKHLLKESQRPYLPRRIIDRRKHGFNTPVSHWFNGAMADLAKMVTYDDVLMEWFDRDAIDTLWRNHRARIDDNGLKLFGLTCLGLWLRQ